MSIDNELVDKKLRILEKIVDYIISLPDDTLTDVESHVYTIPKASKPRTTKTINIRSVSNPTPNKSPADTDKIISKSKCGRKRLGKILVKVCAILWVLQATLLGASKVLTKIDAYF